VKRYRPGAPPASPHLGARALPAGTVAAMPPTAPWYRRLAPWTAIVAVAAAIAVRGGQRRARPYLDAQLRRLHRQHPAAPDAGRTARG
jgi:hypothetical protein